MKSNLLIAQMAMVLLFLALGYNSNAQSFIYSESFSQGTLSSGSPQCTNWNSFRASLSTTVQYKELRFTAGNPASTVTLTNPTTIADIALSLKNGTAKTWVDGTNTWRVGICGGVEFTVNNTNCRCNGTNTWTLRPCINNSNWGGEEYYL